MCYNAGIPHLKEGSTVQLPATFDTTPDGFALCRRSLAELLNSAGIETFPNAEGETRECRNYFDDWYLCRVSGVSGLVKLREQEFDAREGRIADGDSPGVTVSFIAFDERSLTRCLASPTEDHRRSLSAEIDRVVAARGQRHHPSLKSYFVRTEAQGPYLIAARYCRHIAGLAAGGRLRVPERYAALPPNHRLRRGIEAINAAAGAVICDHQWLQFRDPARLTPPEQCAILATHTGNLSLWSFAAEVQFHARFLLPRLDIRLPLIGSVYASAIRADLSVDDREFQGPTPYYNDRSRLVRRQRAVHGDTAYLSEGSI